MIMTTTTVRVEPVRACSVKIEDFIFRSFMVNKIQGLRQESRVRSFGPRLYQGEDVSFDAPSWQVRRLGAQQRSETTQSVHVFPELFPKAFEGCLSLVPQTVHPAT